MLITFSKSGVTTMTFSKANVFPNVVEQQPNQVVTYSQSRKVFVATLSDPEIFYYLNFVRLSLADYTNLLAFFNDTLINWSEFNFDYTDIDGVVTDVRWISGTLTFPNVSQGRYSVQVVLRKEIA